MEAVFIRELGIHPWDQLHPSNDESYITVTLLHQDYAGAWKAWCEFSSLLTQKWPNIVQWHTKLLPYYSKTQEYLSLKNFAKSSQPGDIFRKNESTGIYSRVIHLNPDPFHIDPNSMACYRTSVTLMQESNSTLESLWQKLSQLTDISKPEDFKSILADEHSISFRFYDAETHGVAQLICHSEHLPFLNETIKKMNLEEIQQEGVYAYIHS